MSNVIDGLHVLLDGQTSDVESFKEENLDKMMKRLASDLKMDIIFGPQFQAVELDPSKLTGDVFRDEGGVSGYCMISTSHISIHVWPMRRAFLADIFSCKDFDAERAVETVREFIRPSHIRMQSVIRSPYPEGAVAA